MPYKFFPKLSPSTNTGISHSIYTSSSDIVGKFRMFENMETPDARDAVASYLSVHSTEPLTRSEMLDHIALKSLSNMNVEKMF